jgi:hypothetical protein
VLITTGILAAVLAGVRPTVGSAPETAAKLLGACLAVAAVLFLLAIGPPSRATCLHATPAEATSWGCAR